jgi:hypothetical protein
LGNVLKEKIDLMKKIIGLSLFMAYAILGMTVDTFAQKDTYWQQRAEYSMDVNMDVKKHQFTGKQTLVYHNNSPETLDKVFYHLYFNAFQPGSMMDTRSRLISDPDSRVGDRISKLSPEEIGYQRVKKLTQDGVELSFKEVGTILEVKLDKGIAPGQKSVFKMEFEGQVPVQIRRSGRNNSEGVDYSMAQWYPKMCEYDYQGWHSNPYIGREFHGVWGDFDVKINIDKEYIIAATGYLQNPQEIGYGYEEEGQKVNRPKGKTLTWHFKVDNVHDFVWAADPDYVHETAQVPDGPLLRFFYLKGDEKRTENWKKLPEYTIKAFQKMNENFGVYPYKSYSVVQGGDGGMEYPMATLILGDGSLGGLVGVTVHELIHSWFQGVIATNESLYAWMDEGFNTFAGGYIQGGENPHKGSYRSYFRIVERGIEEPLRTHADHFEYNSAYGMAAYSKGCVFLAQLGYVIGDEALMKGMKLYFETWKFKHPNDNDIIRIMEKVSGLELDWYKEYFVNTTYTIDYGIKSVTEKEGKTQILLEKAGRMPMPLDVVITYKDGSKELHYIPLEVMRGEKPAENASLKPILHTDWAWVYPNYTLEIGKASSTIKSIEIDPSERMADINRKNNVYTAE